MKIIKTTEYFKKSVDELVTHNENFYTKEEHLMFDDGLNVTFFDNIKEYKEEEKMFNEWIEKRGFEVKAILETVNERIAFVLI